MRLLFAMFICTMLSGADLRVYPVTDYRVIDGDTIEVSLDLGFDLTKKSHVRVAGVNTPEVRGIEKEAGDAVKMFVQDFLSKGVVTCQWLEDDKYGGRFVGSVFVDDRSLAIELLKNGLAKPYHVDETKPEFTQVELQMIQAILNKPSE